MSARRLVLALAGLAAVLPAVAAWAESIQVVDNGFTPGESASQWPDTVTGNETTATSLGLTPQQAMSPQAIAFQTITPMPEPQTWATLALGLGALGVFVRGRRRTERAAAAA